MQLVDGILKPQGNPYSRLNESQQISKTRYTHFINAFWKYVTTKHIFSSSYASRDIPLQCLDARALLARTTTSTPASSLDLEWEHETIPVTMVHEASTSSW